MKRFIGTKLIAAVAMTRAAYNDYRDWALPANENGDDAGYLVGTSIRLTSGIYGFTIDP